MRISPGMQVDDHWLFFLSDLTVAFHQLEKCPFSTRRLQQLGSLARIQLSKFREGGACLNLESLRGFLNLTSSFLQMMADGLSLMHNFHSMKGDSLGKNGWFHPCRTGKDLFSFRLIKTQGDRGLSSWVETKPLGNFGFSYVKGCSTFRLFAPRAEKVALLLFADQDKSDFKKHWLEQQADGSWSLLFSHDSASHGINTKLPRGTGMVFFIPKKYLIHMLLQR